MARLLVMAVDQEAPIVFIDPNNTQVERLSDGSAVPSQFVVHTWDAGTQLNVSMTFAVVGGEIRLIRLFLEPVEDGDFITPSRVRDICLGAIIDQVRASIVRAYNTGRQRTEHGERPSKTGGVPFDSLGLMRHMYADNYGIIEELHAPEGPMSRRGRPVSDEDLRRVADVVEANPYDRRMQVAHQLHVSPRTASRWIAEAKRRGFIEERANKKGAGE